MRVSPIVSALAALATPTALLPAQEQEYHPLPELGPDADPRDAQAYYDYGIELIIDHPESAANTFWWASRLNPSVPEPLYAEWAARHLSNTRRFELYVDGDERVLRLPEVQRIDSLALRAFQRHPFFFRNLAGLLNEAYFRERVPRITVNGRPVYWDANLNYLADSLLRADTTSLVRAWLAYTERRFDASLRYYGQLLAAEEDPEERASIHAWRGHIQYLVSEFDSAQASFQAAAEALRERDESQLVVLYESKAMFEYCRGVALEAAGRREEAFEAYAQALIEDFSFYAAHERIGRLALAEGDWATALTELQLATEADPTAVVPLVLLGWVHYQLGDDAAAVASLTRAIGLEPYYAEPQMWLALARERLGDREGALAAYRTFIGLAKAADERRPQVERKIAELGGA